MKIGKKIFVGIYVCLFALTVTLSGVIIGFSALNGDFLSQFQMNYYTTPEILSDDYGYYVEMGEYPQTFGGYVDTDGNATSTNSSGETVTTTMTSTRETFTYVAKNSSTTTTNVYADSESNRYIQYTVNAYSTDYTFLDGTSTASGDAYFKIEPIKWRILGYYEDSAYTNEVVDGTAVFVKITSVSDENYSALLAHCDAIVVQSELGLEAVRWYTSSTTDMDYPDSTIYKWLESFYSTILLDYDSYISSRTIDYNDSSETSGSEYDTSAMTTSEKIWLLSYTEASGVFYLSSTARYCSPSDFGIATYCAMNTDCTSNYRTGTGVWWLRSSFLDSNSYFVRNVTSYGNLSYGIIDYYTGAVRPAMLLNLSSDDNSGSGSASTVEILSDSYGYYVEMGEYPQTFAGYVSDVSFTDSGEEFAYVATGGSTATKDVYIDSDGNRYIQYTVNAFSTSYTFVDGTATASGDAYFKLEPIKWRILGYYEDSAYTNEVTDSESSFIKVTSVSDENYNALVAHSDAVVVQSELGLEAVRWYIENSDVDYPDSTIYNWLNTFYSTILLDYDSFISSRTIDYNETSEHTSGGDYVDASINKKIWLISYTEANGVFYSGSTARCCSPSDFGLATYCILRTDYTSNYRTGTTHWWLRSSFLVSSNYFACFVSSNGDTTNYYVYGTTLAVRPAMLLNLNGNSETIATATSASSITGMGSVSEIILTSTASTEGAILTTASVSEKRRLVLCVEN